MKQFHALSFVLIAGSLFAGSLAFADSSGEERYQALEAKEQIVQFRDPASGHVMVGSAVREKRTDNELCRKRAPILPIPIYRYACFRDASQEVNAEEKYNEMAGKEFEIFYRDPETSEVRVGAKIFEKVSGKTLCQKSLPVVPSPVSTYQCFEKIDL